jgi:hypothetical protein
MALAHQAHSQKVHPQMVAMLGSSGVGKTVFLGMLMDMLSRQTAEVQVLARGAFSINLQQATTTALARCEFPEKTANEPDRWNWVHCLASSQQRKRSAELIMPDMAGEAILEEMQHPKTFPVIRALLKKCAGALMLLDAVQLEQGHHDQEHFAMKLLSFLIELDPDPKHGWSTRPIAVVFTKADQCESCFSDPAGFAQQKSPAAWKFARQRFRQVAFFGSGVVGAGAHRFVIGKFRQRIPLRIEPRGVTEPFVWTFDHLPPPAKG